MVSTEDTNATSYIVAPLPKVKDSQLASCELFEYIRMVCDRIAPGLKVEYTESERVISTECHYDDQGNLITEEADTIIPYNPIYTQGTSSWPDIFAKRVVKVIKEAEFSLICERYQQCTELHESLKRFGIDLDKYFYLSLWLRDYILEWKTEYHSYSESLNMLRRRIERGDKFYAEPAEDGKMEEIFFPDALLVLIEQCSKLGRNSRSEVKMERSVSETTLFGCFMDTLADEFIKGFEADNSKKKRGTTSSPRLIACKTLYAIKMTDDKDKYYDHDPIDNLKKWKNQFPKNLGKADIIHPSDHYQIENEI